MGDGRTVGRMLRIQVHLPDALYRAVKERRLPASQLLREAVQAELRRQELSEEADRYVAELLEEVGEPSPGDVARAEAIARRIGQRTARNAPDEACSSLTRAD
jgi:post-segregation antitoxin (ccd killing protein)